MHFNVNWMKVTCTLSVLFSYKLLSVCMISITCKALNTLNYNNVQITVHDPKVGLERFGVGTVARIVHTSQSLSWPKVFIACYLNFNIKSIVQATAACKYQYHEHWVWGGKNMMDCRSLLTCGRSFIMGLKVWRPLPQYTVKSITRTCAKAILPSVYLEECTGYTKVKNNLEPPRSDFLHCLNLVCILPGFLRHNEIHIWHCTK